MTDLQQLHDLNLEIKEMESDYLAKQSEYKYKKAFIEIDVCHNPEYKNDRLRKAQIEMNLHDNLGGLEEELRELSTRLDFSKRQLLIFGSELGVDFSRAID